MRSGQLLATNDSLIADFLSSDDYDVRSDGTIWTRITKTGKVSVSNVWREAGFPKSEETPYWYVSKDRKHLKRARIVNQKFLAGKDGNPELAQDLVINHKDGNSLNDHPSNLELVPQGRNNEHRFRELNRPPVIGNKTISYEIAEQIRADKRAGFTHRQLMNKYSIKSKGWISQIVNNKIWTKEIHSK